MRWTTLAGALAGTRSVSTRREPSGLLRIEPPPKERSRGDGGWGSSSRVAAVAVVEIANRILILADQGATGAIAAELSALDAAMSALPPGDGAAWGENVLRLLRDEGALDVQLAAPPPAVIPEGEPVLVSVDGGEPVAVPIQMVPPEAVEVAPGYYSLEESPPGVPWLWIGAGGALVIGLGAWLALR